MSYKPLLLACTVVGMIHTLTQPARALSCAEPGLLAPMHGSTDAPTNGLVWCSRTAEANFEFEVTDAQGSPVSGSYTQLSLRDFRVSVFRPSAELAPNTEYRVNCSPYYGPLSFTTGAGPRHQPPALPNTKGMSLYSDTQDEWGPSFGASFSNISAETAIVVLDLDGTEQLDSSGPSGSASSAQLIANPLGSFYVGRGPCAHTWPEAAPGVSAHVRLGAFDLTGAFSGWTEPVKVTVPEPSRAEPDAPAPDVAPIGETGSELEPVQDVISTDLVGDAVPANNDAAFARESSGCQLGASSGSGAVAGLLAALALVATRRQRRNRAGT